MIGKEVYKTSVNAYHNVTLCIHCIWLILSIKYKELQNYTRQHLVYTSVPPLTPPL